MQAGLFNRRQEIQRAQSCRVLGGATAPMRFKPGYFPGVGGDLRLEPRGHLPGFYAPEVTSSRSSARLCVKSAAFRPCRPELTDGPRFWAARNAVARRACDHAAPV